jgi:prepilin-type N-terminal cleavage/methylation domain-containing protein
VCAVRSKTVHVCENEPGYTLAEVLTAVAIMSITFTIGVKVLLALLERWRAEAAAEQFAADLRLAHTKATEQLTDWRVVFMADGTPLSRCSSADYCMVKLNFPYGSGDPAPTLDDSARSTVRELPDGTKINEVTFDPDCSRGERNAAIPPSYCGSGGAQGDATRTLEFNSNGTVRTLRPGQSGTVVISSEDGSPVCPVVFNAPTSRIRIGEIFYPWDRRRTRLFAG